MSTPALPFDAVLFDIGGTLVEAAPPEPSRETPV